MSFSEEEKKEIYDNLARELVSARLIVRNCISSCVNKYLKEQYFVGTNNYPPTAVEAVVLITSFIANRIRNGGDGEGNKEVDKLEAIVSLHLADNNSNDEYSDDNDESVKSFKSTNDLNDIRTSSDNESIAGPSIATSKLKNNNIYDNDDVTVGDNNGNNNNDNDSAAGDDNSEDNNGEASDSGVVSASSVVEFNHNNDDDTVAPLISMVVAACENVENGIDSDIVDSGLSD